MRRQVVLRGLRLICPHWSDIETRRFRPEIEAQQRFSELSLSKAQNSSWLQLQKTSVNVLRDRYHGEREAGSERPAGPEESQIRTSPCPALRPDSSPC